MADSDAPKTQNPEESNSTTTNSQHDIQNLQSSPNPNLTPESNPPTQLNPNPNCVEESLRNVRVRASQTRTDLHPSSNKLSKERLDNADSKEPETRNVDLEEEEEEREDINDRISIIPHSETHKDFSSNLEEAAQVHVESNTEQESEEKKGLQHEDYVLNKLESIIVNSKTSINFFPFPPSSSNKLDSHYNTKDASFSQSEKFEQNHHHHQEHINIKSEGENYNKSKLKQQEENHLFHRNMKTQENFNGVDYESSVTEKKSNGGEKDNNRTDSIKIQNQHPKSYYSAKNLGKRNTSPAQSSATISKSNSTSRIRLGNELELKKFYDIGRNKYDEILQMHRATNAIISIFATCQKQLKTVQELLQKVVCTADLDTPVTIFDAWIGTIAEVLKLLNQESIEVKNSTTVGKQRHLLNAKKAVEVNMEESTTRINFIETILEKLNKVVKSCENSVTSISIGCRSRFFQSVWQTDMLYKMEKMNDRNTERKKGQKGGQLQLRGGTLKFRVDSSINDMFCVSSSMSSSSLLSLHLLTPYIRWDVDGISMRKNIARSWPFIKFTSLNFQKKTTMISEFFAGFISFLEAPIYSMTNALETLEESSNLDSFSISSRNRPVKYYKQRQNQQNQNKNTNQNQHSHSQPHQNLRARSKSKLKGNSEIISMLDHQFQIILNCLLSERYFHPREQHIALVCSIKIKESFKVLEDQLEMVRIGCGNIRETWRRVFRNGDINLSTAHLPVESTNVHLWKSTKRFSFQLDLEQSTGKKGKLVPLRKSDIISTSSNVKLPKLINKNIQSAIEDHFETLEDYEESYETRLFELVHRKELFIVENDIRQCADLPQQFFYYFEHIGTTLNRFTQSIISKTQLLLDSIPTDPPTSPTNYSDYTPLRARWGFRVEEPFVVVALMGWESGILEMLSLARRRFFKLKDTPMLQRKLVQISKSLDELKEVLRHCIQTSKKAQNSMNRLLKHIESYFDPLNDPMNTSSQAASTENLLLDDKRAARKFEATDKKEKIQDPIKNSFILPEKKGINKEGEVSILVTNNGVYFNQFGVLFASRLDTTTAEHQLRIIELFANHIQSQIDDSIKLVRRILEKFGKETFPTDSWWRFGFGMKSFMPPNSSESLLIDGTLHEEVYSKSIFYLMRNLEAAFKNENVKAHLSIYSELEALVLIRTSRILEEEILLFEKSCSNMRQGLKNLSKFQRYFKRAHNKLFNSSLNGSIVPSSRKISSPFEKWNQKISCFKLIIHDDVFKTELDRILTSTASENLSRSSSTNTIKSNKSKTKTRTNKTPKSTKSSLKRSKTMSQRKMKQIIKNHEIPAIIIIRDIKSRWNENVHYALKLLHEENAYTPESKTKLNHVNIINKEPSRELPSSVEYLNMVKEEENSKFQKNINSNGSSNNDNNNYLSYMEGSAICIACGVTQLKLETFPPRFKYQLMKKIKHLCSRITECRAIVSHGIFVCNEKLEKITSRLDETLQLYSHIHQRRFENDVDEQSLSTLTSQEIIVNENDPDAASLSTFKNMMSKKEEEEENEHSVIKQPTDEDQPEDEDDAHLHEQDVFISLNFAFESLILSYRGYERSALFRSWSKKPPEQTKIMEIIMDGISDRLSDIVDNIRKISFEHIHLNRSVKKLSEKIKESLPLPLSVVTEIISALKNLKTDVADSRIPTGLQNVHNILSETENHLTLALKFLHKVTELEKEEQTMTSKSDNGRGSTLTIRNPFERVIRELVKKPIRIIIPNNKLNHFKLW